MDKYTTVYSTVGIVVVSSQGLGIGREIPGSEGICILTLVDVFWSIVSVNVPASSVWEFWLLHISYNIRCHQSQILAVLEDWWYCLILVLIPVSHMTTATEHIFISLLVIWIRCLFENLVHFSIELLVLYISDTFTCFLYFKYVKLLIFLNLLLIYFLAHKWHSWCSWAYGNLKI